MAKYFLSIFCLVLLSINALASDPLPTVFEKYFRILPTPQKIELTRGKGLQYDVLTSLYLQGIDKKPVLGKPLDLFKMSDSGGKGALSLILSNDEKLPASSEGYILEIKSDRVTITARTEAGLFYGCQSLLQLIEDGRDQQMDIPSCIITDYPSLAYRAVHLDLKHHLDVALYYYDMIDRLARIKVNAVIVEFEDKLRYRGATVVGASNALSVDEFAAISRYAKERHIEISPLVQGLGHAGFILKHDEYKVLRDDPASDWAFDPLNPETYEVQFSLYEDAMAATPYGKYLHVGGDEVGALGKSELSKKSGKNPAELQMYWLNKVCEFARQHNRIPIFWDDMVLKLSGLYETTYDASISAHEVERLWKENEHRLDANIKEMPKDCIYMRWNYWDPTIPGNLKTIDWYQRHGLNVMAATAATNDPVKPMMPRDNSGFETIKAYSKVAGDKKIDKIFCTMWDDTSPHFETLWRGIHHFASLSWHYTDISAEESNALFRHRFYAPALAGDQYQFQNKLEKALGVWETILVEKGSRNSYPKRFMLLSLPDDNNPSEWSKKYAKKISAAKDEISRYAEIKDEIGFAMKVARRNRYSLELMNEINELQVYSSNLLLLLSGYDQASTQDERKKYKTQIEQHVNGFSAVRAKFENVYSKTRILNKPKGYILDNSHHLANGSVNSDWMYIFELAMNKKIKEWLIN